LRVFDQSEAPPHLSACMDGDARRELRSPIIDESGGAAGGGGGVGAMFRGWLDAAFSACFARTVRVNLHIVRVLRRLAEGGFSYVYLAGKRGGGGRASGEADGRVAGEGSCGVVFSGCACGTRLVTGRNASERRPRHRLRA
jgi:hypothetical protein